MNLAQLRTKMIRNAMAAYSDAGGELSPTQVADAGRFVLDAVFHELQAFLQQSFGQCEDLHEVYTCPECKKCIALTEDRTYTADRRFTHTACMHTVKQ